VIQKYSLEISKNLHISKLILAFITHAAKPTHLTIQITEAQLGYLAYLYPDNDPEEAW
jgi:hypothetical protein